MKNLILISILFFALTTSAQNPVDKFVNNELHRNANISLLVKDLKTNKILYTYRANNAAIPASTLKLVTTAAALEILGADYQFKTTLQIDGKITADGVLNGNLYVYGSGDPTLGSSKVGDVNFLTDWVAAVRKAGIKQIDGDIIADATSYDTAGVSPYWTWEDIGNYYAAGAYGIAYKDNTYELELKSGAIGTTPQITKITPDIPEMEFINYLKSSTIKMDSAYIYGAPYSNLRTIYGQIPANRDRFVIKGDIPRPGFILAKDFAWKLKSIGIKLNGNVSDIVHDNNKRRVIYTHLSVPLSEIIKEINFNSNNQFAEHLFRHLALKNGVPASSKEAVKIIQDYWKSKGLPVDELFMVDGCGLSPMNAVSANFFVSLLSYMEKSKNSAVFNASLPISGINGTLKNFLSGTALAGKVQAKSGSINRVRSYTGYINENGKKWAFAVVVNNPNSNTLSATTKKIEEFLLQAVK